MSATPGVTQGLSDLRKLHLNIRVLSEYVPKGFGPC
jgi:hypothetical protein